MTENTCTILATKHANFKFKCEETMERELLSFDCFDFKTKGQLKKKITQKNIHLIFFLILYLFKRSTIKLKKLRKHGMFKSFYSNKLMSSQLCVKDSQIYKIYIISTLT